MFLAFGLLGIGFPMFQAFSQVLSDIEAHQFKIMPLEKSRTGRVYRFQVEPEQLPKTGNIILIQENDKPTMAFRVLHTDSKLNEFIAKRVRRYDAAGELNLNVRYQAAEKVSEVVAPPPPEAGSFNPDAKPLLDPHPPGGNTLDSPTITGTPIASPSPSNSNPNPGTNVDSRAAPVNVEKYDSELDGSTSPTNLRQEENSNPATKETVKPPPQEADAPELKDDTEIIEKKILDSYRYLLGLSVGTMKNQSNFSSTGVNAGNFSIYFARAFKANLFFKQKAPQDSLSAEWGFGYYSLNNYNNHNDDYVLLPLKMELHYHVHFSEGFGMFLYTGIQYNMILSTQNVNVSSSALDQTAYNSLHGFQANLGLGILYNIGPQWYLRGELGLDRLAIGLAVKW